MSIVEYQEEDRNFDRQWSDEADVVERGVQYRRAFARMVHNVNRSRLVQGIPAIRTDTFRILNDYRNPSQAILEHDYLMTLTNLVHHKYPSFIPGSLIVTNIYAHPANLGYIDLSILSRGQFRVIHSLRIPPRFGSSILFPCPVVVKYDNTLMYMIHLPLIGPGEDIIYTEQNLRGYPIHVDHPRPVPFLSTNMSADCFKFDGVDYLDLQCTFIIRQQ